MGSRPPRMKVRWGCPPRVLSPPPHRTRSWRPCLPGQPWVSGWRSTDRPVPSPCGWTIGFSERGAAHNHALLRCLSSRRCMRSWRSRGWPLSRPEAARPPPPSSPSTAEWPGGTRAFPRWRERSRCTCAHETLPLGGTVRVSRPRPVNWHRLSRPKLTVLRARQPPPCMPWLSCRFTKPRRSNRCTRVVPTRGWCRSCARRLTSLYERRKSWRGPSGRRCPRCPLLVVQERHLWLNLAEMKDADKARFLDAPISQAGLFGDTVDGFAQQFSAVQQQTEAIQHILPRRDAPSTAALCPIYGTSMCGSWTGRGRLEWSTTGGGRDHHSGWSSFNKANLRTEMESVHDLVFFSPRRPPKMHDWSSAFFPARKVGAYAVTLHLESVCSRYCGSPRYSGRPVPGKAWSHCEVPEGGFPPGLPLCPLGTSLSSWLEFRGAPLSRWTQSSWSSCLLRQSSWPRSLPSNGSGNSRRFREAKSDLCSGQSTLRLSWDPGLDTCPRFPPRPSEIRWWTCKHCPQRRQIQP